MTDPQRWSAERLERDRQESISRFRAERLREPLRL